MFEWLRNMGRPKSSTGPERNGASKDLNEARQRNQESQKLGQTLDRIQERGRSTKKYWGDITIPRTVPGRSMEELREIDSLLRESGMVMEAASLNLEASKETLRAVEGLNEIIKEAKISDEERAKIDEKIDAVHKNDLSKQTT